MLARRALILVLLASGGAKAEPLRLQLPVAYEIGRGCLIQNYVDRDSSPGVQDYQCGSLTYGSHNGTDIRLPSMREQKLGVAVLAAADVLVLRARDGVPDMSVRTPGQPPVEEQECGNGAVIAHTDGFDTQYCHLAQGSLQVRPGKRVAAGQVIGRVGLSGNTEYPHLHFTVRHQGRVVDFFAYGAEPGSCGGGEMLWADSLRATLAYNPTAVLNTGFATVPVTMEAIEAGEAGQDPLRTNSPTLVGFVRAIGLKKDDVQRLTLRGPAGEVLVDNTLPPPDRDKAQTMLFAGKRRPATGWPVGSYEAEFTVTRAGRQAFHHQFKVRVEE